MGVEKDSFGEFSRAVYGEMSCGVPQEYSPLVLAYVGDAVLELYVRTGLLSLGNMPVHKLHVRASHIVSAKAQSHMMDGIEGMLTEEEQRVFKRGRNAKSYSSPKNTELSDYKRSTGLEALIGYLYIKGDFERLDIILRACVSQRKGL